MNGGTPSIAAATAFFAFAAAVMSVGTALLATNARRQGRMPQRRRGVVAIAADVLRAIRERHPRAVAGFARRDFSALVEAAGVGDRLTARDVAAARIICVLVACALLPRIAAMVPLRALPVFAVGLVVMAAEAPVWWLRRAGSRRAAAVREALPDALELLRACLGAGLALRRSLVLVADHSAEPVASEFACVAAETALGVPQATALDGLAARNPQPEIRTLVAAIRQAEKHGSPLAPVIAAQAEDARLALNREIVERGARAAPKIQLIVSVVIVPSALLGFAAVLIAALAQGRLQFF